MLSFYSRILVAYDGSDLSKKALDYAITLAKQDSHIQIDVVSVADKLPYATIGNYGVYNEELVEEMREQTKEMLEEVKTKLKELPNPTRIDMLEGHAGEMIVEFAKENDCDLIIMGNRGLSGLKELFLGSISHYVVQRSHCPVFVVK